MSKTHPPRSKQFGANMSRQERASHSWNRPYVCIGSLRVFPRLASAAYSRACNRHSFCRAWHQLHNFLHLYCRFSRAWQQLHSFPRLYIAATAGFPPYNSSCIISRICIATLNCNLKLQATGFDAHGSSSIIYHACIIAATGFFRAWQQLHSFPRLYIAATAGFSRLWQQLHNSPQ